MRVTEGIPIEIGETSIVGGVKQAGYLERLSMRALRHHSTGRDSHENLDTPKQGFSHVPKLEANQWK